jgi:hypothetical protein
MYQFVGHAIWYDANTAPWGMRNRKDRAVIRNFEEFATIWPILRAEVATWGRPCADGKRGDPAATT